MCAALFLIREHGIPVVILEQQEGDATDPRAATFHPPTLEMLKPSGVTDELLRLGIVADKWQRRDRRLGLIAEFDLGILSSLTEFPFRLQCEQHKLVKIVRDMLKDDPLMDLRLGEQVISVSQDGNGVIVESSKGQYEAEWLLGTDGGRSVVRKSQPFEFNGFTYSERFLVITSDFDFEDLGYAYSNYISDPVEWCAVFKVPAARPEGLWRTVFSTKLEDDEAELLDFETARARLHRLVGADRDFEIVHTNLYSVNQRVANNFRYGRVLLAGDAAHLNNPLGGMGMNFGIHDAENVARSIARWTKTRDDAELDLYDRQRRFAAETYLQSMTIKNKESLEEKDETAAEREREHFRSVASSPDASRELLANTSMIKGLKEANQIA